MASLHNVGDLKFYYPSWDNTFSIIHTYSFETNKHHLICCAAHSGPLKGERKKFLVLVLMFQHMKKKVITVLINAYAIYLQPFLLNDQCFNLCLPTSFEQILGRVMLLCSNQCLDM